MSTSSVETVPTVESERLILRPFRPADFEPMAAFYASNISRFYGGPCPREEAWRKFAIYPGHWALRGYGPWALEDKASGEFVGISGMWFPDGWHAPEITWALVAVAERVGARFERRITNRYGEADVYRHAPPG